MFFNVCLHSRSFSLPADNLKAQLTGSHRELEVEFKFQRYGCNLSFLFLPHRQSTPESLLADYPECGMNVYLSIVHFPKQSSNREVVVVYLANVYINRFFFFSLVLKSVNP